MTAFREGSHAADADSEQLGGDPPCWAGAFDDYWDDDGSTATRRPDLSTPAQVHDLVIAFYREIMFDELLEPIFGEVAEVDWVEHIPRLIDYWCSILFSGSSRYSGSVTQTHRHLHSLQPIEPEHCDRWFSLWTHSVDEGWDGPNAERAKRYAAALMAGMAKRVFGFVWSSACVTPDTSSSQELERS
jgi:hemoglobin